jgi:hypothetical protein
MALITSAQSGNFNATSTWTGGIVPTVGDEARASTGHTVTITANATCDEISIAGTGIFTLNDGVTLTANVTNKSATANRNCLQFTAAAPAAANIVGICTGGTVTGAVSVINSGSGNLTITGNVLCGSGNNATGVWNSLAGTISITGNVTGNSLNGYGSLNGSTGTITITGNVLGGSSAVSHGALNNSTGTISIIGNVTAGSNTGNGANNASTGTLSIIGTVTASQTAAGVAGANVQQVTILSGPFITETTRGVNPVYCAAWRWNASPSNSTYLEVMTNNLLTKRSLVTEDNVTGMPSQADVKSGVVYGPTSALTGTFSQTLSPSVSDIATAVWGAATRTITGGTVDTLTNAPTVPSAATIASQVRTELTTELGRIDAAISSRLAPSGTLATVTNLTNAPASVTPADIWSHATRTITGGTVDTLTNAPSVPSATTIASQVRTELSTELGRLDATVSSRLASASYTAPANSDITAIKAKTDALPSDPADQSLLEAAIAGVTAPSASTVATAVRTELTAELAKVSALNTDRLAQVSTVSTTGSQLAAALS